MEARMHLESAQMSLQQNPDGVKKAKARKDCKGDSQPLPSAGRKHVKHKSRHKSLNVGDANNRSLYALFKSNMKKSAIHSIIDDRGKNVFEQSQISNALVR